jgi:hypothetical protein
MNKTELVEKFKESEVGYSLSLFAQKEVVIALMAIVILILIAGLAA